MIIGIILKKGAQQLFRRSIGFQIPDSLLDGGQAAFSPGAAGGKGQGIDPGNVPLLLEGGNVCFQSIFQGFIGNLKIHPSNKAPRRLGQQGQDQRQKKKPLHIHHLVD